MDDLSPEAPARPSGPESEPVGGPAPLLLVTGFLRRLLDLHLDLVDEVEGVFEGSGLPARPGSEALSSSGSDEKV